MTESQENWKLPTPKAGEDLMNALLTVVAKLSGASQVHLALVLRDAEQETRVFTHPGTSSPPNVPNTMEWVISHNAPLIVESPLAAGSIPGLSGKLQGPFPLICVPLPQGGFPRGAIQIHLSHSLINQDLPTLLETLRLLALEIQNLCPALRGLSEEHPVPEGLRTEERLTGQGSRALRDVLEQEKQRISQDIHDSVLQNLIIALRYLRTLNEHSNLRGKDRQLTGEASALLEETIRGSREVIDSLASGTHGSPPLVTSLRQELKRLAKAEGIKTKLIVQEVDISKESEAALYWIASEAIANAVKHSATTRLQVTLKHSQDQIVLEVRDWGAGFDPQVVSLRKGKNLGLPSLHRQAQRLGGSCQIKSAPGKGTTVRVTLPSEQQGSRDIGKAV